MEDFLGIIGFISIIFGILNIILFFKIWDMTDNVKSIKKNVDLFFLHRQHAEIEEKEDAVFEAKVSYFQGELIEAKKVLDRAFFHDLVKISHLEYSFDERYNALVIKYKPLYEAMNIESPNFDKYADKENL
jgi:hypothetical protein